MFQNLLSSPFFSAHPGVIVLNIIQFINLPMMFLNERSSAMPYSKFAAAFKEEKKHKMIPSRQGMLIIYAPAFLVALLYICLVSSGRIPGYSSHIASLMVLVHFLKRTLETLFLHKYSGSTVLSAAQMIGFAYAFQTALTCITATPSPSPLSARVGSILFVVGILGNLYHHYILACLRSGGDAGKDGKGMKKYVAPRGGMFQFVAAPHYFFELIGWLGVAIGSEQITTYLVFGGMVAYLSARSMNQNEWNRQKFSTEEWPASRKNLIPLIF